MGGRFRKDLPVIEEAACNAFFGFLSAFPTGRVLQSSLIMFLTFLFPFVFLFVLLTISSVIAAAAGHLKLLQNLLIANHETTMEIDTNDDESVLNRDFPNSIQPAPTIAPTHKHLDGFRCRLYYGLGRHPCSI